MALGDEVATYLAGAGIGLSLNAAATSATPVFGIPFPPDPEAPDASVAVIAYAGRESLDAFGASLAGAIFERARFQVLNRDITNNQQTCVTLAGNIYKKLRHFSGTMTSSTGGTVTYAFVRALGPPSFLKLDENQRAYWFTNYECMKSES